MANIEQLTSRKLNIEEVNEILELKDSDITRPKLMELFAYTKNKNPRFTPQDSFFLDKDKLFNSERIETTIGRYIFNLFIVSPWKGLVQYKNGPIGKKGLQSLEKEMVQLMMDGKAETQMFIDYLDRISWFGYANIDFIIPGLSMAIIKPNEKVLKRKAELLNKHKVEIEKGNADVAANIEKQLVTYANEVLGDDSGMDLYRSGAKMDFSNTYKNFNIMKGPVINNKTKGFNIVTSNFIEGVSKQDSASMNDSIVFAAYSRGVGTQEGGYISKQIFAAFQNLSLAPENSDCKTKKTLSITLDSSNISLYYSRYFIENNQMKQLTPENADKYMGKTLKFRSVMFCQSDKLCHRCAGDLYYKMGISNFGLSVSAIGGAILNMSLKKFHNTTIKRSTMDWREYFK